MEKENSQPFLCIFFSAEIDFVRVQFGTDPVLSKIAGNVIIDGEIQARTYYLRIGHANNWIWARFDTNKRSFNFNEDVQASSDDMTKEVFQIMVYVDVNLNGKPHLILLYETLKFSLTSKYGCVIKI